jgi:hypothetical protein
MDLERAFGKKTQATGPRNLNAERSKQPPEKARRPYAPRFERRAFRNADFPVESHAWGSS